MHGEMASYNFKLSQEMSGSYHHSSEEINAGDQEHCPYISTAEVVTRRKQPRALSCILASTFGMIDQIE
jgi:hypothetical protein